MEHGKTDKTNRTKEKLLLLTMLSAVLFLPSMGRFVLDTSSMTAGLVLACSLILANFILREHSVEERSGTTRILIYLALFASFVAFQTYVASSWNDIDYTRAAFSLLTLLAVIFCAYALCEIIKSVKDEDAAFVFRIVSGSFIIIGLMATLGIQPVASGFVKPAFPFTEPSHYALSFSPFLLYQCVSSRTYMRIFWLAATIIIALLIKSLSLVAVTCIAAVCCLSIRLLSVGVGSIFVILTRVDLSYFVDRLDLSIYSQNVSTLVYIQGVELFRASLEKTMGWGIGFQQLGYAPLNVPTSQLIYIILHDDANIYDGGFLAAKLVAEMGVFGIALSVIYMFYFLKSTIILRSRSANSSAVSHREMFCLSVISSFFVEMFVRGVGYFSGTVLVALAAFMYCRDRNLFRLPLGR